MDAESSQKASPDRTANEAEPPGRLAGYIWRFFFVVGAGLVVLGAVTLALIPVAATTATTVAGVAFIADALLLCLLASRAEEWRGFAVLGALTGVAGIALLPFIGAHEPFRMALILALVLATRGVTDIAVGAGEIEDFTGGSRSLWGWILLGAGVVILLLGVLAFLVRNGSMTVLMVVVGGQTLARGVGMLAVASRLRSLT